MKIIPLREPEGQFKSRAVFEMVLNQSPQRPLTLADMRMRGKVLDKLDAERGGSLMLEDAEHEALKAAASTFPWAIFHRDLMRVLEDLEQAKAPPEK